MTEPSYAAKEELLRKYAQGLTEIWQRLVDQGPDTGDPLVLFAPAVELCEKSLRNLLK